VEWDSLHVTADMPNGRTLDVPVRIRKDAFGNSTQSGCVVPPHVNLRMEAVGRVAQSPYRICGTAHGMYSAPTALTTPSEAMLAFLRSLELDRSNSVKEKAYAITSAVHRHMAYQPGSTDVLTSAARAFELGQGVCQDYAHITLALLREAGIPARYVCGLLSGEGATHAWVEWFDSGVWLALDPTHDRAVEYGCIKIAHGRDSADCPVNRGIFTGRVQQQNSVSIKVEEL
jgi:transglutaminase-like putative cysteine protease